jgi:hypothetical protein
LTDTAAVASGCLIRSNREPGQSRHCDLVDVLVGGCACSIQRHRGNLPAASWCNESDSGSAQAARSNNTNLLRRKYDEQRKQWNRALRTEKQRTKPLMADLASFWFVQYYKFQSGEQNQRKGDEMTKIFALPSHIRSD